VPSTIIIVFALLLSLLSFCEIKHAWRPVLAFVPQKDTRGRRKKV